MLTLSFFYVVNASPKGRKLVFRWLFEYLARRHRHLKTWTQMNYGFASASGAGHTIALSARDETERYCHQLYHHAVHGHDLENKDIVEVSSGRGGGASFVHRYFRARTVTGIDIAQHATAFCRQVHRAPGLRFLQGDAEDLPLFDDSADAVVNIEASFCYGNMDRFFAEVHRVLRPGGLFFYADLRHTDELDLLSVALRRSGLTILEFEDISDNVIRALALDASRRAAVAEMNLPRFFRHAMRTFAGAPGTRIPTLLVCGQMRYFRYVLGKPACEPARAAPEQRGTVQREAFALPAQ